MPDFIHYTLSGREEGDPSPMGYGRRGPAAYRNGNGGGLGATPGSQRYVQPTVKDKHGVNSFLLVVISRSNTGLYFNPMPSISRLVL